ncbi:alkaline phosphatase family protein [Candidatus Borrarchaeum sp.]|uniref:alkaline phosphatase family protein n=1 Tax=Candidatus Borrarchaeum sp. TaxID=2846742 RepID=UPI00257F7CB3|nr:alkaline phosphatase family protein [Candidatus Borrarchaeum sp.]
MSLDLKSISNTPFSIPDYHQNISMVVPSAFKCLDQDLGRRSLFDLPQTKRVLEANECMDAETAVVILVDTLGFTKLQEMSNWLFPIIKSHGFQLSSTCPTITSTCLMSAHTGLTPCEHGIVGHKIYIPEYDNIIDFLKMSPIDFKTRDSLMSSGINFRKLAWNPSLYDLMNRDLVAHVGLIHHRILGTGLSNLLVDPKIRTDIGYANMIDLFAKAKKIIKNKTNKKIQQPKMLLNIYIGYLDELSHLYGPNSQEYLAGFHYFEIRLREFINTLEKNGLCEKTTLFLFSDHGQVPIDKILAFTKDDIEQLGKYLSFRPGRSGRAIHFYIKSEFLDEAKNFLSNFIGDKGVVYNFSDVVDFLGCLPSNNHNIKRLQERFGDLIVFLKTGYHLDLPKPTKEKKMDWIDRLMSPTVKFGSHGSLTLDELIVPCLASNVSKIAQQI